MDPQTIIKATAITNGVLFASMFGIIIYCEIKQKQMDRTMANIDRKIAEGNHLMRNWHRMPPR